MESLSLTKILKEFNVNVSAVAANKILINKGLVLELKRQSMKDPSKIKKFKVVSGKGLTYGRNIPSPVHPVQTSMEFYPDTFQDLADIIKAATQETKH